MFVHVGEDLPDLHCDALQLTERLDKPGEGIRREGAKVELLSTQLRAERADSDLRARLAHAGSISPVVFCITLSDAIELGAPAAPEAGRQ